MIRPGEPWGSPATSAPDVDVTGDDAALARAAAEHPGALVQFRPDATSDLARAVGLTAGATDRERLGTELPLDALVLGDAGLICNMCVIGTAPDRLRWWSPAFEVAIELDGRPWFAGAATTVVIAIGQFLRGLDLVPRGHPGDGRAEIQVYDLQRRERRPMRSRLAAGAHVPHPRLHQRSARTIAVRTDPPAPWEADSLPRAGPCASGSISVVPGAYRLLV